MNKTIVVVAMLAGVGCAGLQEYEGRTQEGINDAKPIVNLVDPMTGGIAGYIYTGVAALATSVFGVNRAILAKKRGDAIKDIDVNPNTPPAADQVTGSKAQKVIIQVVGTKAL